MKQFKLVAMSICSVLLLLAFSTGPADAQTNIPGSVENDGQDYVGRIIVITDVRGVPSTHCGEAYFDYGAVIINPGGGPAIKTTVGIDPAQGTATGDRFDITSQTLCNGTLVLTLLKK